MSDENVRKEAQEQAEHAFVEFIKWSKWTTYGALAFFLAVASCNFGVEKNNPTGPQYDGSAYSPTNLNVKDDH